MRGLFYAVTYVSDGGLYIEGGVFNRGLSLFNTFSNAMSMTSVQEGLDRRCGFYIFVRGVIFGEQFC